MTTTILLEMLIAAATIVCGFLVAVLWRTFSILSDTKEVSTIAKKRAYELDASIDKIEKTVNDGVDIVKSLMHSLEFLKTIKQKIEKFSNGGKNDK